MCTSVCVIKSMQSSMSAVLQWGFDIMSVCMCVHVCGTPSPHADNTNTEAQFNIHT